MKEEDIQKIDLIIHLSPIEVGGWKASSRISIAGVSHLDWVTVDIGKTTSEKEYLQELSIVWK